MEYVLAVEDLRHFGHAAERCNVTQSTLSTMLARLEDELGVQIFDRSTKPITTTHEGKTVIRQLRIIQRGIEDLNDTVASLKGEKQGSLKIGVIPTIGPYLLPRFLHDFVASYPYIHFEVSEITTEQIVDQIHSRELDIGIVSIPLDYPDIIEVSLYDEPFYYYDRSPGKKSSHVKQEEIDFRRLWLLEEGHCMRTQVKKICGSEDRLIRSTNLNYKSATISTLIRFVRQSDGVTLLPYLSTKELNEEERGHIRPFVRPIPARTIGLIHHKHFSKKEVLINLANKIKALIDADPDLEKHKLVAVPPV